MQEDDALDVAPVTADVAPRLTYLPDVLSEHVEELGILSERWAASRRATDRTLRDMARLELRIEAHADAIRIAGAAALPLLAAVLDGDDPDAILGAVVGLAALDMAEADALLVTALAQSTDARQRTIADALVAIPLTRLVSPLHERYRRSPEPVAAVLAEVMAAQRALPPAVDLVARFTAHELPSVRASGWRLAATTGRLPDSRRVAAALDDPDAAVRAAALEAALWGGHASLLGYCRYVAADERAQRLDVLRVLALLGTAEDLPRMEALLARESLEDERFRLAASYGHPAIVDAVLPWMARAEPATAAAAAEAFRLVTGEDVATGARVPVQLVDDPFDAAFVDEVAVPDVERAGAVWGALRQRHPEVRRFRGGADAEAPRSAATVRVIDLAGRWEALARARWRGTGRDTPIVVCRLPFAAGALREAGVPVPR
jgi:uncharacterized protein (TIGR02270 family)